MARFTECFPRETKFWKCVRSGFCIGLTCLLVYVAYKTLVSTPVSYLYTSSSRNANEAHNNDTVSSLIDSKESPQSNLKKTVLDANFTFNYMLDGKDTCKVWRELRGWTIGTTWWQKLCELENEWATIEYQCKNFRMMGNWPVCFDSDLVIKPCLVYSFGIDNDFRFDDALAALGCTVYSFDPSMNVQDHKHAERVFFKAIGLSHQDNDKFIPRLDAYVHNPTTWRVRRLTSIMKELGHDPGNLTILKMDIESNEWDVLSDLLACGVLPKIPQVLVEWHLFATAPPRHRYGIFYEDYFRFKGLGFQKFYMGNPVRQHDINKLLSQAENAYVNSRFLASSSETSI